MKKYPEFPHDNLTRDTLERLRTITSACTPDMHEPEEQGISATVEGNHLDNAMGSRPPEKSCGEFIVTIKSDKGEVEHFNLATLIALARRDTDRPMTDEEADDNIHTDIEEIVIDVHDHTIMVAMDKKPGEIQTYGYGLDDYAKLAPKLRKIVQRYRK